MAELSYEPETLIEKQTWVLGLAVKCPCGEAMNNCPANELRELPLAERFKVARDFGEPLLDAIIEHHENRIKARMS